MEWFVAGLIILPAIFLALGRSSYLMDYVFFVVVLNRGIRRLVDYYFNEAFNPLSPISLTPLIVAALMMYPAMARSKRFTPATRRIFVLLSFAVAYGFAIGVITNGVGAIYSLGEWLSALSAFAFAATAPISARVADRWIKSCGYAALLVAAYGWYQYLTIPPWDAFWVTAVGFVGYLGNLVSTEMSVFSTMHERGPCASFLAWAAIPMILSARWRILGGWITILLLLSVVMLTMSRTMFIIVALVAMLQPALSKGKGLGRTLMFAGLFTAAAYFGVSYLPGSERIQKRFETAKNIQEDGSYQSRLRIFTDGVPYILTHPLGVGLGSSGVSAARIEGAKHHFIDSGYIQIFGQFGWLGGSAFFLALWKIWKELGVRIKKGMKDSFVFSARAILLSCMVFLYVGDIFGGFALYWVFFGVALNRLTLPVNTLSPSLDEASEDVSGVVVYSL